MQKVIIFSFIALFFLGVAVPSKANSSGTGFLVNSEGYILTNNHVVFTSVRTKNKKRRVALCRHLNIKSQNINGPAKLIAWNKSIDLAILKLFKGSVKGNVTIASFEPERPRKGWQNLNSVLNESDTSSVNNLKSNASGINYVRFADTQIQPGANISLFGFPLGKYVSSQLMVNSGIVVATTGPRNNDNLIQIDAAANPGNSGSPVLNSSGNLVGILSGGIKSFKKGPKNIEGFNFAIKSTVAERFLHSKGIQVIKSPSTQVQSRTVQYQKALRSVVHIACSM